MPFAEVIGSPVGHSLSPQIHRHWLSVLGLQGSYVATRVESASVRAFVAARRQDRLWRGANVTAPHKQAVLELLDRIDHAAAEVGAVNCIYRGATGLTGANTDLEGIGVALADLDLAGQPVAIIGGGGAARAALQWLRARGCGEVSLVLRRAEAGASMRGARAVGFDQAAQTIRTAHLTINATPLGLAGGVPMPNQLVDALRKSEGVAAFDMVYRPLETPFLAAARENGLRVIDGLTMLVGQAQRSFRLFFGSEPPVSEDAALRRMLTGAPPERVGD